MISCEGRLILSMKALKKLQSFKLLGNNGIFEIQVVGSSASWEYFSVFRCPSLRSLRGLPNLKNLQSLSFCNCSGLQVVEGLDQLECLKRLMVWHCEYLERLIDLSTTKLPDDCDLDIDRCEKLRGFEKGFVGPLQSYKRDKERKQEQESHFEQEFEPRRNLGRVWFQCLSFSNLLHCVLPWFFPCD